MILFFIFIEFKGDPKISHIDGSFRQYFSNRLRTIRIFNSIVATFSLIIVILGAYVSVQLVRLSLEASASSSTAENVSSILNAVLINGLNSLYSFVAVALTEWENHRTDTEYENSMIVKIFAVQFINSYASFFYLAFIAPSVGDCESPNSCMRSLASNLGILFATELVTGTIIGKVIVPKLLFWLRQRSYKANILASDQNNGRDITVPEKEFLRQPVNLQQHNFDVYAELVLQFGYTSLFASALPIMSLYAFGLNVARVQSDCYSWFHILQRPPPKGGEDIGSWQAILEMITRIAAVTNAALVIFTMRIFEEQSVATQFWVFIGFQWTCVILQTITKAVIHENPDEVNIQLMRTKFIVSKIINNESDDVLGYERHEENPEFHFEPIPHEDVVMIYEKGTKPTPVSALANDRNDGIELQQQYDM